MAVVVGLVEVVLEEAGLDRVCPRHCRCRYRRRQLVREPGWEGGGGDRC